MKNKISWTQNILKLSFIKIALILDLISGGIFVVIFLNRVSLYSPAWSGTCNVDQAGLKTHGYLPASVSAS